MLLKIIFYRNDLHKPDGNILHASDDAHLFKDICLKTIRDSLIPFFRLANNQLG
jgi:hypothetical protein